MWTASFAQALPLTGGAATGPLTANADWALVPGGSISGSGFWREAAGVSSCAERDLRRDVRCAELHRHAGDGSEPDHLDGQRHGDAAVRDDLDGEPDSSLTAGTRNVSLRGCALRGASTAPAGARAARCFCIQVRRQRSRWAIATYAADTSGFHLDNVVINTTASSSSTAQALIAYRTQEMDLESLYLLGNCESDRHDAGWNGKLHGRNFLRQRDRRIPDRDECDRAPGGEFGDYGLDECEHVCAAAYRLPDGERKSDRAGHMGINLQQGDGNTFTGGDVEGCATALHLGPNAQNNTIVGLRNENSTIPGGGGRGQLVQQLDDRRNDVYGQADRQRHAQQLSRYISPQLQRHEWRLVREPAGCDGDESFPARHRRTGTSADC